MKNTVLSVIVLLFSLSAHAEWEPVPPKPFYWDWIQLTSGEWLKGEIIALYNHEMEFESEKLDTLTLDITDIKRIRSGEALDIMIVGKKRLNGQLVLDGDTFYLQGQDRHYPVSSIITITADASEEANLWVVKYSLGANLRSGNTNQLDLNSRLQVRRRSIINRMVLDYLATTSETEEILTAKNHRITFAWDIFLTERRFIRPVYGEYIQDPFQNLDNKFTLGSGIGYQIFDNALVEWSLVSGPGYLRTRFEEVEAGQSDLEESAAFITSTNIDVTISSDVDFFMITVLILLIRKMASISTTWSSGWRSIWVSTLIWTFL